MAIEKDLGRIATALEGILEHMKSASDAPAKTERPKPATRPEKAEAPAAPPAPAEAPAAPPAPAAKTPEEMNAILVAEFKRIGNRAPIDAAMKELGVTSVTDLPADKQQELIDKVADIQPGA